MKPTAVSVRLTRYALCNMHLSAHQILQLEMFEKAVPNWKLFLFSIISELILDCSFFVMVLIDS